MSHIVDKVCTYRHATSDDLGGIMLINDQFEHKWTIEKFQEVFTNEIPLILIYNEDEILIGYLVYFITLDEGRIINIAIDPQYQNKSYGRQLIHHALEEMYESNVHYALLDVKTDNLSAISLYTKMGFQILCRRIGYYAGDIEGDSYFMQLRL
jgi:ribosomal-protein-alanine N-acetyltransferase